MKTSDFYYDLPEELIAQDPLENRSDSRLMVLDKKTGVTWRNCICDAKSNIPGCWERMYTLNVEDYSKPIGEVTINKKIRKDLAKQAKNAPVPAAQQGAQTPQTAPAK